MDHLKTGAYTNLALSSTKALMFIIPLPIMIRLQQLIQRFCYSTKTLHILLVLVVQTHECMSSTHISRKRYVCNSLIFCLLNFQAIWIDNKIQVLNVLLEKLTLPICKHRT